MLAARALLAFIDPAHPDTDLRFDGAILIAEFLDDVHTLRRAAVTED